MRLRVATCQESGMVNCLMISRLHMYKLHPFSLSAKQIFPFYQQVDGEWSDIGRVIFNTSKLSKTRMTILYCLSNPGKRPAQG